MIIESWNEWDPLEHVIVGHAYGAQVPRLDKSLLAINYADRIQNTASIQVGPYPDRIIKEANEDLELLCEELKKLGVQVFRPEVKKAFATISNGYWETEEYYSFCPRDSVLIHGKNIIEAPMPLRSRSRETDTLKTILNCAFEEGADWIAAPKPQLKDDVYNIENITKDMLTLKEDEIAFDAANVLRCGQDLFYLVSNSGNKKGGQWLQRTLGPDFRVHLLEGIYSYMHLDSTLSFLRPGLVLLNPSRINENNLPKPLQSWDKIWCSDPIDIGYAENYCHASPWIGMNLLMINPSLAIVEEHQKELIKQLQSHRIEALPLPARHSRTLGGGFHCVTLDLKRKGKLENYF